jgi:Xaa-Pro aminopeptidase
MAACRRCGPGEFGDHVIRVAPADLLAGRAAMLRTALGERHLDALLVTNLANISYLTGFFASAGLLLVTPDELVLVGDGRYSDALHRRRREYPALRLVELAPGETYDRAASGAIASLTGSSVGFEAAHLTVSRHRFLIETLQERGWQSALVETQGLVEQLRVRKDDWEVERLREGAGRLSSVAKCILPNVLAGESETAVAARIDAELRRAGFDRPAFDTIVASGPNAGEPHARAGQRRLEAGDLVVLDFGGVLDGYCTDLTRTVIVGPAAARERRLIEQVVEAQLAAFTAAAPGVLPEVVDAAARGVLERHGVAEAFTHGTGHGLGLEVHEAPRVTRSRPDHSEPPLAPGMVMTLEPGAYFSGWGGVRIEDDVLVTADGAEWLTDVPRIP